MYKTTFKVRLNIIKRIIDNPPYTLFSLSFKEQADWIFNTLNPFQCKIILQETYNAVIPNAELDSYIMNGGFQQLYARTAVQTRLQLVSTDFHFLPDLSVAERLSIDVVSVDGNGNHNLCHLTNADTCVP